MNADAPPELTAFLRRLDAYVHATGGAEGPLSNRLFGASDRVAEIRRGGDVGARRLWRASEALAALEAQLGDAAAAEAGERPRRISARTAG
jgi:hypothetical protein